MFEQPSSTTNTATSSGSGSETNHYFELGAPRTPVVQSHPTSVIVQPGQHHLHNLQTDTSPVTPYYPTNGYGFPLFLGTDFLQFPPTDITSPITPNISSPLTPHPFGPIPAIPTNQLYNRSFPDFYTATTSSPMVQYSTGKKSSAGRKPKEEVSFRGMDRYDEDNMDDDDDDKKLKRRQRNKEAAARCRQRRIDLMKELQDQVNGHKMINDKKTSEINELRSTLISLKNYLENHNCKLSPEERMNQMRHMTIPAPSQPLPSLHQSQQLHHPLRVIPPRSESVPYSVKSSHSSSSSEQHSPIEDYKPTIDQLILPPISCIQSSKDRNINSMPPPQLPASTSAGMNRITSIPIPHSHAAPMPINRSENIFLEPELKIPKIDPADRTLASLAVEDVERPSALPMLSRTPVNHPITTPSRIFHNGEYQAATSQGQNSFLIEGESMGFLSTNTGLTPSGQPTMNFVSTPTPIHSLQDADLRSL